MKRILARSVFSHKLKAVQSIVMVNLQALRAAIQEKREREGLSLRGAADEIGMHHTTLENYEKGRMPTLKSYVLLCEWLGVSMDEFVKREPVDNQPQKK